MPQCVLNRGIPDLCWKLWPKTIVLQLHRPKDEDCTSIGEEEMEVPQEILTPLWFKVMEERMQALQVILTVLQLREKKP